MESKCVWRKYQPTSALLTTLLPRNVDAGKQVLTTSSWTHSTRMNKTQNLDMKREKEKRQRNIVDDGRLLIMLSNIAEGMRVTGHSTKTHTEQNLVDYEPWLTVMALFKMTDGNDIHREKLALVCSLASMQEGGCEHQSSWGSCRKDPLTSQTKTAALRSERVRGSWTEINSSRVYERSSSVLLPLWTEPSMLGMHHMDLGVGLGAIENVDCNWKAMNLDHRILTGFGTRFTYICQTILSYFLLFLSIQKLS